MYKLRKGETLPKEFKIKVNADESKALQEYLFSVGKVWNGRIGIEEIKHTEHPFMYLENSKLLYDFYESKESFEKDPLPQIQFNDYLYLDFPEKWCIEVTEDNYKELDVWMHRNWKNYSKYKDTWDVTFSPKLDKNKIFYSHSNNNSFGGWSGFLYNIDTNYTLITTDQFRGKFGNLKVHDVEFVKMGETKVQGTEPCEKDYYGINNDIVEAFNWEEKANYYKEKSDSLRCEKWVMSSEIERHKSEIERLKDAFDAKVEGIQQFKDEIRQLKNIIAENNVTISKKRQDIEFLHSSISCSNKIIESQEETIKLLKEKIKILSLR